MGEVYLAHDTRLNRQVALKLLRAGAEHDQKERQRLLREARSAAALNHANIVTIYSIEEVDESIFIVMEYVEGETLTDRSSDRELELARLLDLGAQTADALAAAHSAGVIHRDIKPSNLLVTAQGLVKLLDFGIAKMVRPTPPAGIDPNAAFETAEGAIIGTVSYMSPEQVRGESLDGGTDIFSLGTLLYEAAAGKRPFIGSATVFIMHEIASKEPAPPSQLNPELPEQFDQIIKRALAKDRRLRYQSASEFAEALRRLEAEVLASPPRKRTVADAAGVEPKTEALVGRVAELVKLDEILRRTTNSYGRLVFLTGEPGIGKTALAEAFLRRAHQQHPGVLFSRGQCVEQYGAGEAYLPVLDALGSLLAGPHRERVASVLRTHAPTWTLQFPGSIVSTESLKHLEKETLGATKGRMLREIGNALEELAAGSSLILVLEDLHWADPSTIDLLRYLGRRIANKPIMLVGTFRPADAELSESPLKAYRLEMKTHRLCDEVELGSLGLEHIAMYLDSRFTPHDLPRELAMLMFRKTEGHPLFVSSLVQYLLDRGDISEVNGRWALTQPYSAIDLETPENVRSMIKKTIESLDADDLRALQYASIEGEEFHSSVLAGLLDADSLTIEERLERLARVNRLIQTCGEEELPDGSITTRFRFAHALYQNVLYGDLVGERRRQLHRQAGEILEAHYGDRSGRVASQLAVHFQRGRSFDRAFRYMVWAGDNSALVYATAEAAEHYSNALELVSRLPTPDQTAANIAVCLKRGHVERARSRFDHAIADFDRAIEIARADGQPDKEHAALNGLVFTHFLAHRMDEASRLADEALALAERSGDKALLLETQSFVAQILICNGNLVEAGRMIDKIVAEAGVLDHKAALLGGLAQRGELHFHQTEYRQAIDCLNKAVALAKELGDSFNHLYSLFMLGMSLGNLGRFSGALEAFNEMKKISERNGDRFWLARYPNCVGWIHRELQDVEQATAQDLRGVEVAREDGLSEVEAHSLINLGQDLAHQGMSGQSLSALTEVENVSSRDSWMSWRYNIRLEAARSEYWLSQGDSNQAEQHAGRLLRIAQQYNCRKYVAIAHKLLGEVLILRGDLGGGESELTAALDVLRVFPVPIQAWKFYAALGRLYSHMGDSASAREAFAGADDTIRRIAADVEDERLRETFLNSTAVREIRAAYIANL
jgi:predicted ATPase